MRLDDVRVARPPPRPPKSSPLRSPIDISSRSYGKRTRPIYSRELGRKEEGQ